MKRLLAFMAAILFTATVFADLSPQEAYIAKYAPIAVREMYRSGVPASITLAQGILESGSGRSSLATKGNNHFGIKCHNWTGRSMRVDDDAPKECFRVYNSADESFRDHSDFLRYRDRYKFLFDFKTTDYKSWAHGLKKAGYATDPGYPSKLIKYIETYDLAKYDRMKPSDFSDADYEAAVDDSPVVVAPHSGKKSKAKAKKVSKLERRRAAKAKKARKASSEPEVIPVSPGKLEEIRPLSERVSEELSFNLTRPVYERNGVPFVYSVRGETYGSIASSNHLFKREILKFNDVRADRQLDPGTVVYLQAKKSSTPKGLDMYVVEGDEETLWAISQRFGVKLSSIKSLNGFGPDYEPRDGDEILLRKRK